MRRGYVPNPKRSPNLGHLFCDRIFNLVGAKLAMSDEQDESPKFVVDEDYKNQVAREREELKKKEAEESGADGAANAESAAIDETAIEETAVEEAAVEETAAGPPANDEQSSLPPSFELLVSSLATQGAAALGLLPMGDGKEPVVHLDHAKHFIDLLGVLEEKTNNNLSTDEAKFLKDTLHQLRMAFIQLK
ncbi:MAG: hypothetical protein ACI9G1_005047 [Pirellulaceae bacterium]|jgi:hypothetical protein